MSSNTLSTEQIELEELESLKESNDDKQEVKRELPTSQESIVEEEEKGEIITNPYIKWLNDEFNKNQQLQSEEARNIAESGVFVFPKLNGTSDTFKLGELNRSQDIRIRDVQRKWVRIRSAVQKARNSFLSEDDSNYQEFKIQDYLGVPLFKDAGITSETSRDQVIEILDDLNERVYQERLEVFADVFFGITPEQIDNEYVYKKVTYLCDISYSLYSCKPY